MIALLLAVLYPSTAAAQDTPTPADDSPPINQADQASAPAWPPGSPEAIASASDAVGQVRPDDPHWDLEVLYYKDLIDQGVVAAREQLAAHPEDPELYWHLVRFLFELGERHSDDEEGVDKTALYREIITLSEAGLAIAPDHAHLHFALGIGKGRLGTTRGVLKSLALASDVEHEWLLTAQSDYRYRSINGGEQLPCDAMQSIGIFYRLVPDWWIVKVLSGTRGDLEKSVSYLRAANRCSPNDIGILKELGISQLCIATQTQDADRMEQGRADLEHAMRITPRTTGTDPIDQQHIPLLLADPEMACGYSRDGQQERDREALERAQ